MLFVGHGKGHVAADFTGGDWVCGGDPVCCWDISNAVSQSTRTCGKSGFLGVIARLTHFDAVGAGGAVVVQGKSDVIGMVMKWTGHSDYKAMKPYIDIAIPGICSGAVRTLLNLRLHQQWFLLHRLF